MKTLTNEMQVKMDIFKYRPVVKVGTVEGYAKKYNENVDAAVKRSVERGEDLAWTIQSPAVLTANYAGKAEAMKQKQEAYDNAVVLEDGEKVEIEGRIYTVKLVGERYADPIKFVPVN